MEIASKNRNYGDPSLPEGKPVERILAANLLGEELDSLGRQMEEEDGADK